MIPYYIENEKLIFFDFYNEQLSEEILEIMKTVKKVVFGMNFNQPLPDLSCHQLQKIVLRGRFNHPLHYLPVGLKYLRLGEDFDYPIINKLPSSLETLILSDRFNQPVCNGVFSAFPLTLKVLKFGTAFNQPIGILPANIEYLFFGEKFDQVIPSLPRHLKTLKFSSFNKSFYATHGWWPVSRKL